VTNTNFIIFYLTPLMINLSPEVGILSLNGLI